MQTNLLLVGLRLVHIISAFLWAGSGLFSVLYLIPSIKAAGPEGARFMQTLTRVTPYSRVMTVTAILTTLAGISLLWIVSGGFSLAYFSRLGGVIMAMGATSGLLAFGHGAAVMGRLTGEIEATGKEIAAASGPPAPELLGKMQALQDRLARNSRVSAVLMFVAIVGMAGSRYL